MEKKGEYFLEPTINNQNNPLKKITLNIGGMTCASCVNIIEKTLVNKGHAEKANVNLINEKAFVEFNSSEIDISDLIKAVERVGFTASELIDQSNKAGVVTLNVLGMNYASSANTIENSLNKLTGIIDSNVNITTEKALIRFDPTVIDVNNIVAVINKVGFEATEEIEDFYSQNPQNLQRLAEERQLKRKLLISVLFIIPISLITMIPMFIRLLGFEIIFSSYLNFISSLDANLLFNLFSYKNILLFLFTSYH